MGGALQTLYELHSEVFLSAPPDATLIGHEGIQNGLEQKPISLKEFDEVVTAPIFGYEDADQYYTDISSSKVTENVSIPLLAINSRDDPMVADLTLPLAQVRPRCKRITPNYLTSVQVKRNPWIVLAVTPGGGHMGWFEQKSDGTIARWYAKPVTQFFNALLEVR